jgi:AraC-like DNA-binding protein
LEVTVDKVMNLVRERELPISLIALGIGYFDQSKFTKLFKKVEK